MHDFSYKTTFMGSIPQRVRLDKCIEMYGGIRYLVLLSYLYDEIYNSIKCLIRKKSGITDSINYNFAVIRIDSNNSLPIEKKLTFHNAIMLLSQLLMRIKVNSTIMYF